MRNSAVHDDYLLHALVDSLDTAADLGDHASGDHSVAVEGLGLRYGDLRDKPIFVVFNKIDAYRYEEYDEFSLEPKQQINYTLDEFKNSWIAKENTPCIFISAREKIGIDKLRGDLYKMVAEIHAGRYPFDNFLW